VRLTEIDGDVYVSDSLLPELEAKAPETPRAESAAIVYAGDAIVGLLTGFNFDSNSLEVHCDCLAPPLDLLAIPLDVSLRIDGGPPIRDYIIKEITCDIQHSRCSLKSILRLPEVPYER